MEKIKLGTLLLIAMSNSLLFLYFKIIETIKLHYKN